MTDRLTDERLAELRALQQERIEGRGGVPEVKDLLKALDELAAFRAHEPERLGITEPKSAVSCRSGSHPMSDEACREAERRWPLWLPTGDYETDQENYDEQSAKWQNAESEEHQRAFVRGTQWQAARDAERIKELEAEAEQLRARYYNAAAGSRHLRPGEAKKLTEALDSRVRADAAEALLARIRDFVTEHSVGPNYPFESGHHVARRVLEIMDRDNT